MARTLTPKDAYVLMEALVEQATGQNSLSVTSTADFVSAGELVMQTGLENTLNALSCVIGRLFVAVRPYNAKLGILTYIIIDTMGTRTSSPTICDLRLCRRLSFILPLGTFR